MLRCTKFGENVERNNRNHGLCITQYWTIELKVMVLNRFNPVNILSVKFNSEIKIRLKVILSLEY